MFLTRLGSQVRPFDVKEAKYKFTSKITTTTTTTAKHHSDKNPHLTQCIQNI